jgi:hypothetical protein
VEQRDAIFLGDAPQLIRHECVRADHIHVWRYIKVKRPVQISSSGKRQLEMLLLNLTVIMGTEYKQLCLWKSNKKYVNVCNLSIVGIPTAQYPDHWSQILRCYG